MEAIIDDPFITGTVKTVCGRGEANLVFDNVRRLRRRHHATEPHMASMREDGGYNTLTSRKDKGAELHISSQATIASLPFARDGPSDRPVFVPRHVNPLLNVGWADVDVSTHRRAKS
jgi:hypothetical protein